MFFVTGGAKFHCSFVYLFADKYSNQFAQVCNTQPLWLLPTVGSKLGVQVTQDGRAISLELFSKFVLLFFQEERHFGRGASLCSGHHCHAGG